MPKLDPPKALMSEFTFMKYCTVLLLLEQHGCGAAEELLTDFIGTVGLMKQISRLLSAIEVFNIVECRFVGSTRRSNAMGFDRQDS